MDSLIPRSDRVYPEDQHPMNRFVIVSDRALMVLNPMLGSVAQDGINPQRIRDNSRTEFAVCRITGTGCDGAML